MIDTIRLNMEPHCVTEGLIRDWNIPCDVLREHWHYSPHKPRIYKDQVYRKAALIRQTPGRTLRLFLTDRMVDGLEVSLPNLYFSRGGVLLASQEELDLAWSSLWEKVGEVCRVEGTPAVMFTRVDLSLQFNVPGVPPSAFQRSLRNARHPKVRATPEYWEVNAEDSGVNFLGANTKIKFYDKRLEMKLGSGPIVRIEINLEKQALKAQLGEGGGYPTYLEFDDCYRVYREIIQQFPSPVSHLEIPEEVRTPRKLLPYLMAALENVEVRLPDRSTPFELLERLGMGRNAKAKLRRETVAAQLNEAGISFEELLPEDWPPPHIVHDAAPASVLMR